MPENVDLNELIFEACASTNPSWLTPKGVALLALLREGKNFRDAMQIVDIAYDKSGEPRKGAMA